MHDTGPNPVPAHSETVGTRGETAARLVLRADPPPPAPRRLKTDGPVASPRHERLPLRARGAAGVALLRRPGTRAYVCGLRGLENGLDAVLTGIATEAGRDGPMRRATMREQGRWHVGTY